jgi:chromosomal replication initiator protein
MNKEIKGILTDCINFLSPFANGENESQELINRIEEAFDADDFAKNPADRIFKAVCEHYGVPEDKVKGNCRKRKFVLPRHLICNLAKKKTRLTFKQIGLIVGGIDHSSAMHANKAIKNLIFTDKEFEKEYKLIEDKL